jgi:histidinol phosphatase-like PHP family hydrolase
MLEQPSEPLEPPPLRRGFITLARAKAVLREHPSWRGEIQSDLQMHTLYSDGSTTIAEMAAAARASGHRYIAITDHSKGLAIANGMSEERLAMQARKIAALDQRDLVVLHSIEMNLSPRGEGDMDPHALAKLDIVLAAFHSRLRVTEDQTDRYIAALNNPTINTLAHPRGRIFNFRSGLSADWPRVFDEAARVGKALEIDSYPDRQDLDIELLQIARDAGCWISIGTDAHHPDELRFIDIGIAAAILAGIPRERILNFMTAEELRGWAATRREAA